MSFGTSERRLSLGGTSHLRVPAPHTGPASVTWPDNQRISTTSISSPILTTMGGGGSNNSPNGTPRAGSGRPPPSRRTSMSTGPHPTMSAGHANAAAMRSASVTSTTFLMGGNLNSNAAAGSPSRRESVAVTARRESLPVMDAGQLSKLQVGEYDTAKTGYKALPPPTDPRAEKVLRTRGIQNYARMHSNIERMQSEMQEFLEEQMRRAIEADPRIRSRQTKFKDAKGRPRAPTAEEEKDLDRQQELLDELISNIYGVRQSSSRFMRLFLNEEEKRHVGARTYESFGHDPGDAGRTPPRRYNPYRHHVPTPDDSVMTGRSGGRNSVGMSSYGFRSPKGAFSEGGNNSYGGNSRLNRHFNDDDSQSTNATHYHIPGEDDSMYQRNAFGNDDSMLLDDDGANGHGINGGLGSGDVTVSDEEQEEDDTLLQVPLFIPLGEDGAPIPQPGKKGKRRKGKGDGEGGGDADDAERLAKKEKLRAEKEARKAERDAIRARREEEKARRRAANDGANDGGEGGRADEGDGGDDEAVKAHAEALERVRREAEEKVRLESESEEERLRREAEARSRAEELERERQSAEEAARRRAEAERVARLLAEEEEARRLALERLRQETEERQKHDDEAAAELARQRAEAEARSAALAAEELALREAREKADKEAADRLAAERARLAALAAEDEARRLALDNLRREAEERQRRDDEAAAELARKQREIEDRAKALSEEEAVLKESREETLARLSAEHDARLAALAAEEARIAAEEEEARRAEDARRLEIARLEEELARRREEADEAARLVREQEEAEIARLQGESDAAGAERGLLFEKLANVSTPSRYARDGNALTIGGSDDDEEFGDGAGRGNAPAEPILMDDTTRPCMAPPVKRAKGKSKMTYGIYARTEAGESTEVDAEALRSGSHTDPNSVAAVLMRIFGDSINSSNLESKEVTTRHYHHPKGAPSPRSRSRSMATSVATTPRRDGQSIGSASVATNARLHSSGLPSYRQHPNALSDARTPTMSMSEMRSSRGANNNNAQYSSHNSSSRGGPMSSHDEPPSVVAAGGRSESAGAVVGIYKNGKPVTTPTKGRDASAEQGERQNRRDDEGEEPRRRPVERPQPLSVNLNRPPMGNAHSNNNSNQQNIIHNDRYDDGIAPHHPHHTEHHNASATSRDHGMEMPLGSARKRSGSGGAGRRTSIRTTRSSSYVEEYVNSQVIEGGWNISPPPNSSSPTPQPHYNGGGGRGASPPKAMPAGDVDGNGRSASRKSPGKIARKIMRRVGSATNQ